MYFNPKFWKNKKIFLTGHTGFKGAWCAQILHSLGAKVYGLSISQNTNNLVYKDPKIQKVFDYEFVGDVCDFTFVESALNKIEPDYIIHMAAQSLVKQSYIEPLETFRTNVLGTATILNAAKNLKYLKTIICVTSDKCYLNNDQVWGYREIDRLGGHDPYSCSKAAAELVAKSMFDSFYSKTNTDVFTVRAGNVIGGGDMSEDRLMTDVVKAINNETEINLRYPKASRPWQHVLEPVAAYLHLIEHFDKKMCAKFDCYNVGPTLNKNKNVITLVREAFAISNTSASINIDLNDSNHEATSLALDISKIISETLWREAWGFHETVKLTLDWYRNYETGVSAYELCKSDINAYFKKIEDSS